MRKATLLLGVHDHQLLQMIVQTWGASAMEEKRVAEEATKDRMDRLRNFMMKMGLQGEKFLGVTFRSWHETIRKELEHNKRMRANAVKMGLQSDALLTLVLSTWNADLKKMVAKREKEDAAMK